MSFIVKSSTALAAILLLTGCGTASASAPHVSGNTSLAVPTAAAVSPTNTKQGVTFDSAHNAFLPNSSLTPGVISSAVNQGNIQSTICVKGYTSTVRPPSSYTTALKKQQLASGYNYNGDMRTSSYEEDHLISLELGGSPKDVRNLWPEPYTSSQGARTKDKIENKLHTLVCNGSITLRTAQKAIASNWITAYNTYMSW